MTDPFRRAFGKAFDDLTKPLMLALEEELHRQFELNTTPLPPVTGWANPELVRAVWQRRRLRKRQRKLREQGWAKKFSKALLIGTAVKAIHNLDQKENGNDQ